MIDSHAHLWRRELHPQPWIDPVDMAVIDRDFWVEDLAELQRDAGIDGAIVVQAINSVSETRDLLAAYDDAVIRGIVGWVDLEGDVVAQIADLRDGPGGAGLVGIRHLAHLDADPRWLLRDSVATGLEALATLGLPFDLVVRPDQLELVATVVAQHPETSFVLDHIGKPPIASGNLADWRTGLEAIAASPNVVAKLSGIVAEADWSNWTVADLVESADVAITAFGPERLMFGTDWPVLLLSGPATTWMDAARELTAQFSPAERARFESGNAATTYSVEDTNA